MIENALASVKAQKVVEDQANQFKMHIGKDLSCNECSALDLSTAINHNT